MKYSDAGVSLDRGAQFVDRVRSLAAMTLSQNVLAHIGGFAGCFELPTGYEKPVLVTGADGVGTKLMLANTKERLQDIGQDLVAMVVNDIICCGAKPLFFLDYYATGRLNVEDGIAVVQGISDACWQCDVSLIGGETAELPGLYKEGDFDLAGFGVGIVEKDKIISGHDNVKPGHIIIGIESNGPHSNGFSLIRNITKLPDNDMLDQLLAPTLLYTSVIEELLETVDIKGIANITGGGFTENIPRIVDSWYASVIETSAWERPAVFDWIKKHGNVPIEEMYNVFNMGIGMVVIVAPEQEDTALKTITDDGWNAWRIGEVVPRNDSIAVDLR